jgi:hypothetical protein
MRQLIGISSGGSTAGVPAATDAARLQVPDLSAAIGMGAMVILVSVPLALALGLLRGSCSLWPCL